MRDPLGIGGDADATADARELAFAPARLLRLGGRTLGRWQRLVERVDAAEKRTELEPPEDLLELRTVGGLQNEPGRIDAEIEVAPHRREKLRGSGLLRVLGDRLRPCGRELRRVLDDVIERAVLRDELPGCLVPDARDAGDVVARVALQADEVRDLQRADAVARLDALRRVHLDVRDAPRRHHQADVLGDELERVAIGGDDAGLEARLVRTCRKRRDHVVRLPPLELEVLVAESLDDRPEVRELLAQEIRHRAAVGLVVGVDLLAVNRTRVPCDRNASRPVVREQLEEHVRESEERVRRLSVGRLQLLREREERPVREVVAVDEEELGVARRAVVEDQLFPGQGLRTHDTTLVFRRRSESAIADPDRTDP